MAASKSAQRVQDALKNRGFAFEVIELPESARTVDEAAKAVGCGREQIVKSLIFCTEGTRLPVLVLASGVNRVNEKIISEYAGAKIAKADADFVREVTGFAIGGVPPIGHDQSIQTFIDADLLRYDEVWAAAGTPNAVFRFIGKISELIPEGRIIAVTG
jgi:prolyl-tRNA editing enzyme YbaK/EbsC (Cys-tRNA(Pro) deacylase)